MAKVITIQEAVDMIPDGASVMIGGFLGCGSAHKVLKALADSGKKNLTVIANDAGKATGPLGEEYYGIAQLVHNHQVSHLIATHVGMTPDVATQSNAGELKVDLIPQGSLAEMVRAGGAGLGGVLTPTGVGTIVEDKDEFVYGKYNLDGKDYLMMKPVKADFAIISAYNIDKMGNMWYKGTTRNFNVLMATAADVVIAEADHVVEIGAIEPESVVTPGAFVDYIVDGGNA
ncbi:MAG: 3-oxoacid CoA-transferase subunit A [Clostridia bacterium]|nr:3-oxoacid CoA-transferase subunit A [Clostridia bacterium]